MKNFYAVMMAGGAGVRFWPLGRQALPKQFLDLPRCDFSADCSLLRRTAERLSLCVPWKNLLVATGEKYRALVNEQLPCLPEENQVLEEKNLDTAFAVAGALRRVAELADGAACCDPVVAFLPCDHYISDDEIFAEDLRQAVGLAEQGRIITLGVRPAYAATEYGYMQGRAVEGKAYLLGEKFLEKPDGRRAAELWQQKNMFWNCGIFIGRLSVFLGHLQRRLAAQGCLPEQEGSKSLRQQARLVNEAMLAEGVKISFDRLVMENLQTEEFLIVRARFDWDDLGTFAALGKYWRRQGNNRVQGCETALLDSSGNIVYREGGLVALVGVRDLLVVEADGALLVMPKQESGRLKELVKLLQERGKGEYL